MGLLRPMVLCKVWDRVCGYAATYGVRVQSRVYSYAYLCCTDAVDFAPKYKSALNCQECVSCDGLESHAHESTKQVLND